MADPTHNDAALAALETRLVERMATIEKGMGERMNALEVRLMRDMATNNWRVMGFVAVIAGLLFAALRFIPPA